MNRPNLRRILRKAINESIETGVSRKLNADATNDSSNLDQEVHFGLEDGIEQLVSSFADDERYSQHGVTYEDVFEELLVVVEQMRQLLGVMKRS